MKVGVPILLEGEGRASTPTLSIYLSPSLSLSLYVDVEI